MPATLADIAAAGDWETLERELAAGKRTPNDPAEFKGGFSALYLASRNGAPDSTITSLGEAGADVCWAHPGTGRTALHMAAFGNHESTVQALVASHRARMRGGAPVLPIDMRGKYKRTPLHLSTDPSTMRALLKLGADASLRNDDGATPLELAKQQGHAEVAAMLHTHASNSTGSATTQLPTFLQPLEVAIMQQALAKTAEVEEPEPGPDLWFEPELRPLAAPWGLAFEAQICEYYESWNHKRVEPAVISWYNTQVDEFGPPHSPGAQAEEGVPPEGGA